MDAALKHDLLEIFAAGLAAVRPDEALLAHLLLHGSILKAGGREYDLSRGKIYVAGAGKGAAPLAQALEKLLQGMTACGVIAVKQGHSAPLDKLQIIEAAHPVPDENGLRAAREILETARKCTGDDLLIVLLTGGASALLPAPAHGLTLADLQDATRELLASGAAIQEINAIRKHLSLLSGGQLARAANGARVLAIIVSDVIGDDLGAIASGPAYPDISTYQDCLDIIDRYQLRGRLAARIIEVLENGARGEYAETPKPDDPCFGRVNNVIIASNEQALQACAKKAADLGYSVAIWPAPMQGEARDQARSLLAWARNEAAIKKPGGAGFCFLAGGETTVTIRGNGRGGRNQEMALAAAIELADVNGMACLFAGTDGTDGPVDAAGGFAFADTAAKMGGVAQAREYLRNNDSNTALQKAGELLVTGPTLTNVMDLAIMLCRNNS